LRFCRVLGSSVGSCLLFFKALLLLTFPTPIIDQAQLLTPPPVVAAKALPSSLGQ
jgi:hypothetical protein